MARGPNDGKPPSYSLRHPLVLITAVAIVGAFTALRLGAQDPKNSSTSLLSNVVVFIASGLLSYFITYANDRRQFLEDLEKLARFSRRRLDLLSENLLSLAQEVSNVPTAEEAKRIVGYTLRNLEQDARASVRDIEAIGGIPVDESVVTTITVEPPAASGGTAGDVSITYTCPTCGYSNGGTLGVEKGSTRHVQCANCRTRISLHRLEDGNFRVVDQTRSRLSDFANPRVHSDEQIALKARGSRSSVRESFECPRCHRDITFTAPADQRIIERPCFSCLAVAAYDRDRNSTRLISQKRPHYIPSLEVPNLTCEVCDLSFLPRKHESAAGREFVCCFGCNTVYLANSERKETIEKECPTSDCGNMVMFRMSEGEEQARQFCLDCTSRLLYSRPSDTVQIIEKLSVPQIDYLEFVRGGRACPHCGRTASSKFKVNRHGQRLSICWECKDIFEFVSGGEATTT